MKKAIGILFTALLVMGMMSGCAGQKQIEVTTAAAKTEGDLSDLTWHGSVEALKTTEVSPDGTGKVATIPIAEGQQVKTGTVLFTLDSADAKLALKQAEASYDAAQVALSSASQSNAQNTAVVPAQVAYNDAADNYKRIRSLFEAGAVSQVEHDNAKSKMDTAKSQLDAAKINQSSSYESAQAQVESAKAALDVAKKKLNDCNVISPIDGKVAKVHIEVGDAVSAQSCAVTVIDDSIKKVVIQVAETDIERLTVGLPMIANVQSLGEECQGSVAEIATVGDPKTGMFDVKVELESPGDEIETGMTADVYPRGNSDTYAVYVPEKSVTKKDGKAWVFVAQNGVAQKRNVTVGKKKNAYLAVAEGLKSGEEVILQSSEKLTDGAKIQVITVK